MQYVMGKPGEVELLLDGFQLEVLSDYFQSYN